MGVCDSNIAPINHHPNAYVARVKVVPTVPELLQSNSEDNISSKYKYFERDTRCLDSIRPTPLMQEAECKEHKKCEPATESNLVILPLDCENSEDVSGGIQKEWHCDQISNDHGSFQEAHRSLNAPEPSSNQSGLENYRRLSSAFFEQEERKSDSKENESVVALAGLKNIAPEGFTKAAFREFVKNIPGSESHRAVVLSEFDDLWIMLAGGKDQIPLSRLDAFYNNEKSKEEHNREMELTMCGNYNAVNNTDLSTELTENNRPYNAGRSTTDGNPASYTGLALEQSDSEEPEMDWHYYKKTQTPEDSEDGYQHQLSLEELNQSQSEDDGRDMIKRLSWDSSSTKSLSYPSTRAQEQIMNEYMNNSKMEDISNLPEIDDIIDSDLSMQRVSLKNHDVNSPEPITPPSTPVDKRGLYQGRPVTQTQSKELDGVDDSRFPIVKSEICKDFVFRPGPGVGKRRRVIQRSVSRRSATEQGIGYWEDFEDLNRVSNPHQTIGWKVRRQWRQESLKQRRRDNCPTKDVPSPIVLDAKSLKSICKEWDLSPSIGEDIVATLNAGEKLSTVDLLNRYGGSATLESLKGFYTRSHTMAKNDMMPSKALE